MGSSKPIGFDSDCGISIDDELEVSCCPCPENKRFNPKNKIGNAIAETTTKRRNSLLLEFIPDVSEVVSERFFKIRPVPLKKDEKINPKIN
ncbi:MAG TPA: hypothetical protein VE177_04325 [Candidatus Binatus sp.]|nr:hypothetical protein [Candidatus Binatus sp.]